jgi:plasmid stability protein
MLSVRLPEELRQMLRVRAAQEGRSVQAIATALIERELSKKVKKRKRENNEAAGRK